MLRARAPASARRDQEDRIIKGGATAMSNAKTHTEGVASAGCRNRVGISLMVSSDTEAIVEVTREHYPDAKIDFRDCFYKVEREGSLDWNMDDIGECLGRPYD